MIRHSFSESLAFSHRAEDLPLWQEAYRAAFPTMIASHNHRANGPHQRRGIDRSITLEGSKQILIDEKIRGRNKITGRVYRDIALEFASDVARGEPGWVCKSLLADYIAYAIAPIGKCYLLPVIQLQQAWARYGEEWKRLRVIRAYNEKGYRKWETLSACVPVPVLFRAIGDCLRVNFTPVELQD